MISEISCFEQELGAQIATLVRKSCPIRPGGEAWKFQPLEKMIHIFSTNYQFMEINELPASHDCLLLVIHKQ